MKLPGGPKPITHWLTQRATAVFTLILLLLAPAWFLLLGVSISVFWHLYLGLEEILADYIHNELIENFFLLLLQILIFVLVKSFFLFFIL